MKATVFHAAKDVRVEEVAAPPGPGPGEVLVRPSWCGICGTDLHEYAMGPIVTPAQPHALNGAQLPQILGHEFSAHVVEVGAGVTNVVPGDRVTVMLNDKIVIHNAQLPGIAAKGPIGLQHHGDAVEFTYVFIKELQP